MGRISAARHQLAPYALVAGLVISALLSWRSHSFVLGTVAGVIISISLLPFPSWVDGVKVGAVIGGLAGALAEGILFSQARGVTRIFIASGYGILLGSLWGCLVARFFSRNPGNVETDSHAMIYHIVIESDFRAQLDDLVYLPSGLHDDGFVHCALKPSVVPVANDYYAGAPGRLLLLEIDPARLASETRYEAAAPTAGGGASHLASASQFPHVYGPINKVAITGVGVLGRTADGYEWPRAFMPLDSFLTADR
jgi:uncharacterized protein (DUF952 family)